MKKIVSLILAILIVVGLVPAMAFATGTLQLGDKKTTTVEIGADVTDIDNTEFLNYNNLTEINVDEGNDYYKDIDGVLYTKDGKTLVCYPAGKTGKYEVAAGTEVIESYAFRNAAVAEVTIPDSVTTIGSYAFWGCKALETVTLGDAVKEIGTWAFAYCDSLTAITANNANYVDVDGVLYTADMETLVSYPAADNTATFTVPAGVKVIKNYAFYGNKNLETVEIPASVTVIGNNVFNYSKALTAVVVDEDNAKYADIDGVLYTADKKTLVYYPAAKADETFEVPATVKVIGKSAFENCDNLVTISVSKNVTEIGYAAFAYCDALANIDYSGYEVQWDMINKGTYWDRYTDGFKVTAAKFVGFTNADMTVTGSAAKDAETGAVTLGGGSANKAYLNGGFQGSHFALSATFKVAEDSDTFSFVMGKGQGASGKDNTYYYWTELTAEGGKSYLKIYKDSGSSADERALGFDLIPGNEYTLVMTFDIPLNNGGAKRMVIEVSGENGEYYTCTTTANAYGTPFYYSDSASCVVSEFTLTVDHYYDVENANVVVFGHSFVEGDSLGGARDSGFAYLLEAALADGTVMNFGLGGDSVTGMYNKMVTSERFIENCDYAFLCIGTNDTGMTAAAFKSELQKSIDFLNGMGIEPILFTIPQKHMSTNDMITEVNRWIKNDLNCRYVDMYAVLETTPDDAADYFMGDGVHPTVKGHARIFNAIAEVCPEFGLTKIAE